jgi:hypothetical protein
MKPSLKRLRERYDMAKEEKKEQVRSYARMHNMAKEFQRDKGLVEWWDLNCKGRATSEVQGILQGGVDRREISYDQAVLVLDFLTSQGYLEVPGA